MNNFKYLYIVSLISTIICVFLISFSIYNLPSADDFIYGAHYGDNPLALALNSYFHGSSGRIFSNTLYTYFSSISNKNIIIYQILPIIVFLFFAIVCYLLFSFFFHRYGKKVIFSLTSIFLAIWLLSMNSINDTILWYGGIFNYSLPMALLFFSLYLILQSYNLKNNIIKYLYIIFSAIIAFISSFSNEALFLVFFILYFLFFVYSLYYKDRKLFYSILLNIIILIIVFFLILFSPGSANRAGESDTNLLFGVYRGLMTSLERGFSYYFATLVIPVSIFLYLIFYQNKPKLIIKNMSYKYHGILLIVLGIILSWAAHFVVSYGLGALGLPPRAKVIPQTFSIITFIAGNIYLLYYFNFYDKFINRKKKYIVFLCIYTIFSTFNSDDFTGSLISLGEHKIYYEKNIQRLDYIKNADKSSKEIILEKIPVAPYPITPIDARMVSQDCKYYVNTQLAFYYKYKGCIRLENGQDGDSSLSKKYFRTKDYILKDGARIWFYSLFK